MQIAIVAPGRDVSEWSEVLKQRSGEEIQVWPTISEPQLIELAIAWNPPSGVLATFTNLKLISSLGAGVDHILSDEILPTVPLVRIVDDILSQDMSNYIIMAVLNHQRATVAHIRNQERHLWNSQRIRNKKLNIGILGLGVLGRAVAQKLTLLGFEVCGYSQTPKDIQGIATFSGSIGLDEMVKQVDLLVNLLPLTSKTQDFLNISLFRKATRPLFLINVARGKQLVEEDLLRALDEGIVSGACLDVFREEPLPPGHPFWDHPKIMVTPHIASVTNPHTAVAQILENYARVKSGKPLFNQIDMDKGY